MRQRSSPFFAAILFLAAILLICNCAGYVLFIVTDPSWLEPAGPGLSGPAGTPVTVVAFVTPTPAPLLSAPAEPLPAPLLPTVTPLPQATAVSSTTLPPPSLLPPVKATVPAPAGPSALKQSVSIGGLGPSSSLELLSHQSYIDGLGWHHIVGEVQNNGPVPLEFVEIIAKLYDKNAELISTKITFTAPDVIYPGGKAPFDIITLRKAQWSRISNYELQLKGDLAEELLEQNLILLNQNSYLKDGYLYVSGEVQNTGETPALVKLIVTLYDSNYQVVNTNWSYADLGIIRANDISPFEVKINHRTDPDNYNYRIQIEEALMTSEIAGEQEKIK